MDDFAHYLLASSPAVIYTCKTDGDYGGTYVTENITEILGYSSGDFLGDASFWIDRIHPEDLPGVLSDLETLRTARRHVCEYRFKAKNGAYRWMRDDIRLVLNKITGEEELVGSWLEITEQKLLERRLLASDRIKNEFIAAASHELRTPLFVIQGYAEMMLENMALDPELQREYLAIIHDKAVVLEKIVGDLLDISRIETGRLICLDRASCNIVPIIQEVVTQFQQKVTDRSFVLILPQKQILLSIDQEKIIQVLQNLLSNGVKFSPKESEIVVRAEPVDGCVQVMVADEGMGIPLDQQVCIFDKFYRVDSSCSSIPGLGIGLYLVKMIIEGHGGRVWVESTPGQGARFFFTLPFEDRASVSGADQSEPA